MTSRYELKSSLKDKYKQEIYTDVVARINNDVWSVFKVNSAVIAIKLEALPYIKGFGEYKSYYLNNEEFLHFSFRILQGNFDDAAANIIKFGRHTIYLPAKTKFLGSFNKLLDIPLPKQNNNNHKTIKTLEEKTYSQFIQF